MNKIILIVLLALLCAALYLFVYPFIQPAIPAVLSFVQAVPTNLTELGGWVQSNLTSIIPTAAGVGTVATLLYNQVYKRAKQAQEQLTTAKISEVQNELLGQINENTTLQKTNVELQTRLEESKDAEAQITSLKTTLATKQKEVDAATERANEAERLAKALIPKKEPLKVK